MSGRIVRPSEIQETPQKPRILDKSQGEQNPVPVEVYVHPESVTLDDGVRGRKRQEGDPEIRIRTTDQKEWEKVKRDDA